MATICPMYIIMITHTNKECMQIIVKSVIAFSSEIIVKCVSRIVIVFYHTGLVYVDCGQYQIVALSGISEVSFFCLYMRHMIRKSAFYICENKGTDQLCSDCTADQCLCFHYYIKGIVQFLFCLNPKVQASSFIL